MPEHDEPETTPEILVVSTLGWGFITLGLLLVVIILGPETITFFLEQLAQWGDL